MCIPSPHGTIPGVQVPADVTGVQTDSGVLETAHLPVVSHQKPF